MLSKIDQVAIRDQTSFHNTMQSTTSTARHNGYHCAVPKQSVDVCKNARSLAKVSGHFILFGV